MGKIQDIALNLCKISAPSSNESAVTAEIASRLEAMGYTVEYTPLKSLIAYKGEKSGKRLMLSAHCDTVGVMATYIDGDYVGFAPLGDLNLARLAGTYVQFANGAKGVIGCKKDSANDLTSLDFYIDMGSDASKLVKQGDSAVLCGETFVENGKLYSPAADNRICCAVLLDVAERTISTDVGFAFTAQHKLGARGAKGAYFELAPSEAISLSVSAAQDVPGGKKTIKLGDGPVFHVMYGQYTSDIELINGLEACAEKSQREASVDGKGEISAFESVNGAAKCCSVGIAGRKYSDTAVAVSLEDAQVLSDMVVKYIEK